MVRISRRHAVGGVLVAVGILVLAPSPANAHFILMEPASWMTQDSLGFPEKLGPCGDEEGGTPTGIVTAYHPGDTVTFTVSEVVFHPGHYRIALATDPSMLPPEPTVTADSTPCGSVPVESPAVYPVLADGVFTHTAAFTAPQTVQVRLPTDVTCTNCTLQVIEFMSDHGLNVPGGCFYHHCANISIGGEVSDGGNAAEAGVVEIPDGGVGTDDASTDDDASPGGSMDTSTGPSASSGCGCSVAGGDAPITLAIGGLFVAAAALLRRRR
jgi:MYXO-CTERM domain-containing protein